jgi:ABC-type nitrate/sulfonate/bicarbonate transport system substrate-binding protein
MKQSLVLDRRGFARLHGGHLQVTQGTVWLTIDRQPEDHVLTRGQGIELPAGARALVQALGASARACVRQPDRWWQRMARALHVAPPTVPSQP